ncbi:MAG: hypothetical protein NZ874_08630 [Fimbriimonadales bacterium]|nr:hypothetical protein [Fimbriimonadales bacterium]
MAWAFRPSTRGLDSLVQAQARTGLSVLRTHGLEARATRGRWRDADATKARSHS